MRKLVLLLPLLPMLAFGEPGVLPPKAAKYHELLLKRPKPGAIYERFASAWLEEGDIATLRTFLESRANDAKATTADRLVLGFFLSQQSEHAAAIAVMAKALEADPANSEAWLLRAQTESRVTMYDDALKSLAHVQGGAGEVASDAAKLKARLLARTGQTADALAVLKALAAAHPEDEDLQDEVVELHLDEGLQGEAVDFLRALLERTKDPYQRVVRRLRLGDVQKRAGNRDEALASYSQCLDDAAQDSWVEGEVLAQIEQTFRSKDDLTGLKGFLATLSEKHAQRLSLGQLRARISLDLNEADDAILIYRELLQKNPGNMPLKEAFVDVLARAQKFDDAVVQCRELLTQRAEDKELRIHLSTLLYQAGQPGEAMKELQPLIQDAQAPEFELMRVARLFESFEHPDDSRKLYQRAVDTYPQSVTAQDALASFMHAHKEQLSAVAIWTKQAAAPAPKEEVLRVARALSSRGELRAALEVLQSREKEFPNDVPYLTQLIAVASSAQRQELAASWAMTLIRLAQDGEALEDALRVVRPVFRDPKHAGEVIKTLQAATTPIIQERCLLAELLEQTGDPEAADKLLAAATGGDQTIALRQQARLYVLRQDFEKAASTLEKLVTNRKDTGVIEQLVNLYQRASRNDLALKWAGEWKAALPGSTRPWLAEARALQAQQKTEESVAVLKQAARKFADDAGMSVALAEAYATNNQQADAQRIYQHLYDEAEDLPAQIRWAGQLAEMAQRRGVLKELLESFQERQRGNRTSIAPWLAIAEINRRTGSYEGRRTAMLEASRLKPKDVDLLHQIARMDEDQGDWRKAIETLTAAATLDKSDKTRQRIAEVHLRYGDEETGLRMAFELGGGGDMDPRDAEGMIVGLMARGNWRMAASVIDPVLTHHAEDYRLRYLKMICLIEDDKMDAALNEASVLMSAKVEVLTPSKSSVVTSLPSLVPEQEDPVAQLVGSIVSWGGQALRYRDELRQLSQSSRYYFGGPSGMPQYAFVPSYLALVKPMVTALLIRARDEQNWTPDKIAAVINQMAAAGHPVAEAVQWFEVGRRNGQALSIILAEVEKNVGNKRLVSLWMNQLQGRTALSAMALSPQTLQQLQSRGVNIGALTTGSGTGTPSAPGASPERTLLGKIYDRYVSLDPLTAATAAIKLWQLDSKDSASLDKALALAATMPVKEPASIYVYTMPLNSSGEMGAVLRTPERRKIRDAALLVIKRYSDAHPAEAGWSARAPALHAAVGDWEAFVDSLNDSMKSLPAQAARSRNFVSSSVSFQPITLYHIMSVIDKVPYDVFSALMMRGFSSSIAPMPPDDAKALATAATRLTDPNLRAIIAWRAADKAAFKAYADAQLASPQPVLWPLLVMAHETAEYRPEETAPWLVKARTATTLRDMVGAIDAALVHSVTSLLKDQKTEAAKPYLAAAQTSVLALRRTMATGSSYELEQLASAMESLGMKDEAERQRKAIAATRNVRRSSMSSISASSTDPYQIGNDIRNGKSATAIPQAVKTLRNLAVSMAVGGGYSASYETRRWSVLTNDHPAAAEQIWKQLNTGSPPTTLKQKLERAVLADILGHPEVALTIYAEAVKTKPRDAFLRLRLAMLQLGSEEGVKPALENLLAVSPADLNAEAGALNLNDGDSFRLEQRLNYVRVITSYLRQIGSKARPGDLEWCSRALDVLITSSRGDGPRLPNMLEEAPTIDKDVQPLVARREQLFDEFCAVAVDFPDLAHHVLPAMFAITRHRQKDTSEVIKKARVALVALAAVRNNGVSITMGNDWVEHYNGSWSGRRMWAPMLPEMLLFDANERQQEKQFKEEVVPLVRQIYGPESGNEFELRARLWFCPEVEFLALAKEVESLKLRRNPGSSTTPSGIMRVWKERGLKVSLDEVLADYARNMARKNYSLDSSVVTPYLMGVLATGTNADLAKSVKSLIAALFDKPEAEWRAFLEANPPPQGPRQSSSSSSSGSPQDRIRRVISSCDSISDESLVLRLHFIGVLAQHGFQNYDNFAYLISSYNDKSLPAKAADLVGALETTPYLNDISAFESLEPKRDGYSNGFAHLAITIQRKGRDYSAAVVEALQKRQEKQRTFGSVALIGRLAELPPDLALTLQPYADAFAREPFARQDMLLKVIRDVWADFDRQAILSPALQPFAVGLRKTGLDGANKLLAAKATKDINAEDGKFEKQLQEAVAQAVAIDPVLAGKALEHGVNLLMDKEAKEGWGGLTWFNTCNRASGMIEKTSGQAAANALRLTAPPALEMIGVALRLYEAPDQRRFLCVYREADFRWGEMMRIYWERSGGFGDPRKAVHTLVSELQRVLGTASPALLPDAFRAMAEDVPRWHRALVLDEAATMAKGKDASAAIARELIAGFGLTNRDAEAVAYLKKRIGDQALHPLTRPVLAALLCEQSSTLSPEEVRHCLETAMPLLENGWPGSSSVWSPLLSNFNQLPKSPEWEALARRFREAWMQRTQFNSKGTRSGKALEMQSTMAAHALELFARSSSDEELKKFCGVFSKIINRNVDTVLTLARYNRQNQLREVLKGSDGALGGARSTTRTIKFGSSDFDVTKVIDEALKDDARLASRARLLAISAFDSTSSAPKVARAERLRVEAERYLKNLGKDKPAGSDPMLAVLVDTAASAATLVQTIGPQIDIKADVVRAATSNRSGSSSSSTAQGEILDVPLSLALASLSQGDDKLWKLVLEGIETTKSGNPGYNFWYALSYRVATLCTRHVREQGLEKTAWVRRALRDLIEAGPGTVDVEAAASVHLMDALLRSDSKDIDQWRKALTKDRLKSATPQDALWLEFCLDLYPLIPGEDGGKTLLTVLADPWARDITRKDIDLRYRGKWPARLKDADLRQHTDALFQADPGNLAVLTTVMDSWSPEKDQKPLLKTLEALKPKLDATKDKKVLERIAAVAAEVK